MTTIAVDLYQQQFSFFQSAAKNAAFVGGIGSGKTIAGCMRAIAASQGRVGSETIPVPNVGIITAPTYPMLKKATLPTFIEYAGDAMVDLHKGDLTATMRGGSTIYFSNADDPDRLRGPSISWWYGDEAAMYDDEAWRIMVGRLRQFGRRGWAWITTTPRGRNWVWQRFVRDVRDDYAIFRASTRANPFVDEAFYQDLERTYTGSFARQELYGEFVTFEGLVYEDFDRETHIWRGELPTMTSYRMGVDWGYSNPAVTLLIGEDADGRMYVINEHYHRRVKVHDHAASTAAMRPDSDYPIYAYCDPSEPEHIDIMRDAGVAALAADNAVLAGIQAVKARLSVQDDGRPRLYVAPTAANTIAELESYVWAERRGEYIDQPEKVNDHAMDALRYAVMGAGTPARSLFSL